MHREKAQKLTTPLYQRHWESNLVLVIDKLDFNPQSLEVGKNRMGIMEISG